MSESEAKCLECGKVCANEHGLSIHRGCAHGVPGVNARAAKGGKGGARKGLSAKAAAGGLSIRESFAHAAAEVDRAGKIMCDCVDGLAVLLEAARKLRLAYIERSDKLRKLEAQVAELDQQRA